jgi:O-antigen/teichoic acid export membrane protein
MVRNSMYSLLSAGLQAVLGFAFWVVAARVFSAPDVGRATSLISATTVIAFIALFGLNSTVVRYLPTTKHRDAIITVTLALVASVGMIVAIGYIFALPVIAPQLHFLRDNLLFALGFVLLAGAAGINLLTDSIFTASRRTHINALMDGGVGGVSNLVLIGVLSSSGTYGLFCASVGGYAAAALASLVLIWTQLHYRPRLEGGLTALRPLLRFSGANYLGNVFNLAPTLVVTLIVLDRRGPAAAGFYYVAFQFANVLYAGAYAVEQNFLAEGAHGEERLTSLMRRTATVLACLAIPAAIAGAVFAHWILLVFGDQYARHSTEALVLMALATIPISANNWLVTVLRLSNQLVAITICNLVYAGSICGFAWFLAPRGITMIGASWLLGSLIAVVVSGSAVLWGAHRGALKGMVQVAVPGVADTGASTAGAHAPATEAWVSAPATEPWLTTAPAELWVTEAPVIEGPVTQSGVIEAPVIEAPVSEGSVRGPTPERPLDRKVVADDPDESVSDQGRRWWPFVAAAVALLVGISLATPAGRHQWAISIARQPNHYTTLSFEQAAHLPTTVAAGTAVHLLFAVKNNEGRRIDYSYVVTSANAASSGPAKVLDRARVAVPAGRTQPVAIDVVPVCSSSSCRVQITLPSQSESIDAFIKVHGPK